MSPGKKSEQQNSFASIFGANLFSAANGKGQLAELQNLCFSMFCHRSGLIVPGSRTDEIFQKNNN